MLLVNLIFVGSTVAVAFRTSTIHEKRDISLNYLHGEAGKRVDSNAILPVRIALAQSHLDQGYDYLMRVSDPGSQDYGKHWSLQDIHDHFAPSQETKEAVMDWLENAGIDRNYISETTSGGWLGIDVPASVAERLFLTKYYESHAPDGAMKVGCDEYSVPSHLSSHIDFVTPGIGDTLLRKRPMSVVPRRSGVKETLLQRRTQNITSLPCGELITPACIRALYNIPPANSITQQTALGIFEFIDTYDQEDLNLFFQHFAEDVPQGTHPKLDSINGATAPTETEKGGSESIIDLNLAFSLLYPQNITLYQTGFTVKQAKHLIEEAEGPLENKLQIAGGIAIVENLLDAVDGSFCTPRARKQGLDCGTTTLTTVLSVSYGAPEINMPDKFARRACSEYMKLGLKGHTILFASGDYGPAGNAIPDNNTRAVSNACINLEHPQNGLVNGTVFNPEFPATCPYILSVGATQLNDGQSVTELETVLHIPSETLGFPRYISFSSSGGFSNYFKQPSYQASVVGTYLAKHKPGYKTYKFPGGQKIGTDGGIFNTGGRAFPDVAANGARLATFVAGVFKPQFGTSLSTPIWASLITMINNERASMGKGPVGFVNPALYQNPQIFNDITSGCSPGCDTNGFAATPGWDPTTGLGTPNYPELRKMFLALP